MAVRRIEVNLPYRRVYVDTSSACRIARAIKERSPPVQGSNDFQLSRASIWSCSPSVSSKCSTCHRHPRAKPIFEEMCLPSHFVHEPIHVPARKAICIWHIKADMYSRIRGAKYYDEGFPNGTSKPLGTAFRLGESNKKTTAYTKTHLQERPKAHRPSLLCQVGSAR